MSPRSGRIFIAFLALFVRMAGGQLWQILCYLLYQARFSEKPRDGLYHQQQARLRNSSSSAQALWQGLELAFAWTKKARNGAFRSLYLAIVAAIHVAAFTVAGLFSSRLATSSGQVLISSPNCGGVNAFIPGKYDDYTTPQAVADIAAYAIESRTQAVVAQAYASTCYVGDTQSQTCQGYATTRTGKSDLVVSSCPFKDNICSGDSVTIDSGFIDSDLDFGINAKASDRISYRRLLTCSVLNQQGYVSDWMTAPIDEYPPLNPMRIQQDYIPGDVSKYYYYGNWLSNHNYTMRYSNYSTLEVKDPYTTW